ncbi:hypothetical protein [Streptomyces hydrogenans]
MSAMTADGTALAGVSGLTAAMRRRMLARRPDLRPVPTRRP